MCKILTVNEYVALIALVYFFGCLWRKSRSQHHLPQDNAKKRSKKSMTYHVSVDAREHAMPTPRSYRGSELVTVWPMMKLTQEKSKAHWQI